MRINYHFIPYGEVAGKEHTPICENRLYLDVGSGLCVGVIDHHQMRAFSEQTCTAKIIAKNPELVFKSRSFKKRKKSPFDIVLHHDPDFDCCASAFLVRELLNNGHPPPGAEKLADYTLEVDAGRKVLDVENPYTPYAAVLFLNSHIWDSVPKEQVDLEIVNQTVPLMSTLCRKLAEGVQADSPDSLDWDQPPLCGLKMAIGNDPAKYRKDIADRDGQRNTELFRLPLFRKDMSGMDQQDAVFIKDPESVLFKYWARTDALNSSEKKGFCLIVCNYSDLNRTIVSTNPNTDYFLPFLGQVLEIQEVRKRLLEKGLDDRLYDKNGNLEKKTRWFFNPDPWYDGRGHDYTIVDSPRCGSFLSGKKVLSIVKGLYRYFK